MTTVRRFDAGEILAAPVHMDNGWLRVEGQISRCGIQVYRDGTGRETRELRTPEEVFAPESIASFAMGPVTNAHPPALLDASNARQFQVGQVGENIRRNGDEFLAAPLLITVDEAIRAIGAGRHQLSCGYVCEVDATPGVHPVYGPYDSSQRAIRGNHVALVDVARAGPEAALRLDSGDACVIGLQPQRNTNPSQEKPMQIKIDGVTFDATDANAASIQTAIDGIKAKADGAVKKIATIKANIASRKRRADAVKAHMVGCDECGGVGKVPGEDGVEKKCDYCDGAGKFRMHDAIMAPAEKGEPVEEEIVEKDADELEAEQATETEAAAAHKDGITSRRINAAAKRRADSIARICARAIKRAKADQAVRSALETEARKHLAADAKLETMDDLAVKRAVVAKLEPAVKLDGKDAAYVGVAFDLAIARVTAAPVVAPVDAARAGGNGPTLTHADGEPKGIEAARTAMEKRHADAWKRQAPAVTK